MRRSNPDPRCSSDLSSSDTVMYDSALLPLSFFSAHVGSACLCAGGLAAPSHVHHPWRRNEPVPKSLRRISPSCLSCLRVFSGSGSAVEWQQGYRVAKSLCNSWGNAVGIFCSVTVLTLWRNQMLNQCDEIFIAGYYESSCLFVCWCYSWLKTSENNCFRISICQFIPDRQWDVCCRRLQYERLHPSINDWQGLSIHPRGRFGTDD